MYLDSFRGTSASCGSVDPITSILNQSLVKHPWSIEYSRPSVSMVSASLDSTNSREEIFFFNTESFKKQNLNLLCVCNYFLGVHACKVASVVSDSLGPYGL